MANKPVKNKRANFETVLNALRSDPAGVLDKYARALSDLPPEKVSQLKSVLAGMAAEKKAAFFHRLDETARENLVYDYAPIAMLGIDDPDGYVRVASIHILAPEDSREVGRKLLRLAKDDPFEEAQIAAIEILGQYMYEADMDNPIPVSAVQLTETLSGLIDSKKESVRRAAVVAYALSNDERVRDLISGYLAGNDRDELIAGLTAIHFSMAEDWNDSVVELLSHGDDDVRRFAIRAAGTLQMKAALPELYALLEEFDRIPPDLLAAAVEAVSEIGDEGSLDVLETLGEAAVDLDPELADIIDDCIDTLNMTIYMGGPLEKTESEIVLSEEEAEELDEKIEEAREHCLSILEEKIPHDLEDDEAAEIDEDEDECECGEHHHHHDHEHHHHHHDPLEGLDLSRFRILDDLEAYERGADMDEDEEELWAAFEDMAEEDLDADSLQDFINKLEKKKNGRKK